MPRSFPMKAFFDAHVHLRQGGMMDVVRETMKYCRYCLVMPNTSPPLLTASDVQMYEKVLDRTVKRLVEGGADCVPGFNPLALIYVNEDTTPKMIHDAADAGIIAGKLYPRGRTTGSDLGIYDYERTAPALRAMEERDMVCCLHGEHPVPHPSATVLQWESEFVSKIFGPIVRGYPDLRVVLEHITTEFAVNTIKATTRGEHGAPIAATITAHHLCHTIDDVLADGIKPHNYCKPVPKLPRDLASLRKAATSGDPRFFLGSDSAPHQVKDKESVCGCAGCFTAAYLPAHIAGVFDEVCGHSIWYDTEPEYPGSIPTAFERFTALNAQKFYKVDDWDDKLQLESGTVIIELSQDYGGNKVRNWRAGGRIGWSIKSND